MQAAASIPDTSADMDTRSSASHATAGTSGRGEEDLPFRLFPGLFSGITLQVGGQTRWTQCLARLLLRPVCVAAGIPGRGGAQARHDLPGGQ